jgi:hypothetical protein
LEGSEGFEHHHTGFVGRFNAAEHPFLCVQTSKFEEFEAERGVGERRSSLCQKEGRQGNSQLFSRLEKKM